MKYTIITRSRATIAALGLIAATSALQLRADTPTFYALQPPVATDYTDFTGTSFVANWESVAGATGYLLTVAEYDDNQRTLVEPYLLNDKPVDGTSYLVEGITPGCKYHYYVKATDGNAVSKSSNTIRVYKLATPDGLTLTPTNDGFDVAWNAVPAATDYTATVNTLHTAPCAESYVIALADFSNLDAQGSVADPYVDPDNQIATYPALPGWDFTLHATAGDAAGVEYDHDLAQYGFRASINSPRYDLSETSTGYLNITLTMASTYGNDVTVAYNTKTASGLDKCVSETFTVTPDYQEYKTSLPTGKTPGTVTITPEAAADGDGNYHANVFIKSLKITVKLPEGGTMQLPYSSVSTTETHAEFVALAIDNTDYLVNVTAYQHVPYLDLGYLTRLSSDPSETIVYTPSAGIDRIEIDTPAGTEADAPRYFTLQGTPIDHPASGTIVIRLLNGRATKLRIP